AELYRLRQHLALERAALGFHVLERVLAHTDRKDVLKDDGALIELDRGEVRRASRDPYPFLPCLPIGVSPGMVREQRGMDVDDAVRKPIDELRRKDAHVACEHNELRAELADLVDEKRFVGGLVLGVAPEKRDAGALRAATQASVVGKRDHRVAVQLAAAMVADQRFEAVRLLGEQDREAFAVATTGESQRHLDADLAADLLEAED